MRTLLLTLFIIPLLLGTNSNKDLVEKNSKTIVLELFTSQGCSSCPPADQLLKTVKSDNVIPLSYHVDYWNYIGWKDPFSKAIYNEKQKEYAKKFYNSTLYTPQLVVNGKEHFVGSDAIKLNSKIKSYSKGKTETTIKISNVKLNDEFINFNYETTGKSLNNTLRVILVINERTTSVKRGENRNRILKNYNIVVEEQQFKLTKQSGKGALKVPKIIEKTDELSLVLIVQNNNLDILTAAQQKL